MDVAYAGDEIYPEINGVYHKTLGGRATTESTAKITQFIQRTIATICSIGEYSWYQLSKGRSSLRRNN